MTTIEKPNSRLLREIFFFILGATIGLLLLGVAFWWITDDTILPWIKIGGVKVGGMSTQNATNLLALKVEEYKPEVIFNGSKWRVPKESYVIDIDAAVANARKVGRKWDRSMMSQYVAGKVNIPLTVTIKNENYGVWNQTLISSVNLVPQPAKLAYVKNNIAFTNGEDGLVVNEEELKSRISKNISSLDTTAIELPTLQQLAHLDETQKSTLLARAHQLLGDTLTIKIEDDKVAIGTAILLGFLSVEPDKVGEINQETVKNYVAGLSERYNREPQDAKFEFAEGRVREFAPGKDGIKMNEKETAELLIKTIEKLTTDEEKEMMEAVIIRTAPAVSTSEVNNLGIVERIGRGESYYAHSIANRVYNVGLASSRVTGALVAPGEEFSFNKFVGEISGATGYKTAYVISGGRTVLGDGGGVCQVSTTLFRAAMDAGLPITERWGHAYRVGYYEQNSDPGIDATVYSPSKDFKFVNDTPRHILVQAINEPKNLHLIFEIYGTSDGRKSTVTKPKVWGVTPPPPDLYQDDPTLPAGTIKQVDWSAWGAKTSFDYKVERGGQTIFEKTYVTNYRPWQNVYLRGTAGITNP